MEGSTREQNRKAMRWLWDQMHRGGLKMPPDRLIFEGDHDLTYLYNTGFVDTDRHSKTQWIATFKDSRRPDGSYSLTLEQWMAKEPFRYCGKIEPPFDPETIREGEWPLDEYKAFIKEKLLPETVVTHDMFLMGLEKAQKDGEIVNGIMVVTAEKKKKLRASLDRYASPRRRRALSAERVRQREEFETTAEKTGTTQAAVKPAVAKEQQRSKYQSAPDQRKQTAGKLSHVLAGSKK